MEDLQTFQQEGWHFELNDPSEDITYKGFLIHSSYLFFNPLQHLSSIDTFGHSCFSIIPNNVLFVVPGVVFNEMKGVYSQPDNILGRTAQQASFFMACLALLCSFLHVFVFCIELSLFPILFWVLHFLHVISHHHWETGTCKQF